MRMLLSFRKTRLFNLPRCLGNSLLPTILFMFDPPCVLQEKEHLAAFNNFIPQYRARPTALLPLWHVAGMYRVAISD